MKPGSQNILLFMLALMLVTGCEKSQNMEFTDWPIIESYLHPDQNFNVNVSRQLPFTPDVTYSNDDIDHLYITITYNDSIYVLHSLGDGDYCDTNLRVVAGASFTLAMTFNSKDVSAYTYVPAKPSNFTQSATSIAIQRTDSTSGPPFGGSMPDPIDITWDNNDGSYYLLVIENIEETLDPIRDFGDAEPPGNIFRKQPTTSTSEQIRPMELEYYGTHRLILYHVLPDYATLYDQNSNSSQNLANPSSSIVNGYGIFTGLNSDTLFLEVTEAK